MIGLIDIFPAALRKELGDNPSVLCLRTAEQKYLVFSDDSKTPKFVLQPGTTKNLSIVKDYTEQLHHALPGRIPEPLAILCDQKDQSYLVQRGVAGVPWFTLRQRMGKDLPWNKILKQSISALVDFHNTTYSHTEWNKDINLQNHFRNLHLQAIAMGDSKLVDNSLVFELQLHDSPSIEFAKNLWSQILTSSRYDFSQNSKALDVLLMMHIMWWLIETHGQERRRKRRKTYLKALKKAQKDVLENKPDFVVNLLLMICR